MLTRIAVLTLAAAVLLQAVSGRAQVTNPPYLREFPSVERVLRETKGVDPIDTAARQAVTFNTLRFMILLLVGGSKRIGTRPDATRTPDEDRLMKTYLEAWNRVKDVPVSPAQRERLYKLETAYISAPGFSTDDILKRLFSPEFRASYYRIVRKQPPPQPPAGKSAGCKPTTPEEAHDYIAKLEIARASVALGKAFLEAKKDASAKGQFTKAIETFNGLIAKYPACTQPYVQLAEIYQMQGEYGLAITYWKQDLSIKPDDSYALNNLGLCYEALGDYPSALAATEQAARLDPGDAVLRINLGYLYVKMGRKQEALQAYRKLLTLDKQKAQQLYAEINKMK